MTAYAFLETPLDPTWQTQEGGKFFERGSRKGWVGTLYACALRGYTFLMRTQGAREIVSDVHLDGRTPVRAKSPEGGKGKGVNVSTIKYLRTISKVVKSRGQILAVKSGQISP